MQLTGRTSKLPLARVLALVALLCAGALQVQEVGHGHWHELDDSYSQCLVCKSSGGVALSLDSVPDASRESTPADIPRLLASARPGACSSFDARGPPSYS